MSHWKAYGHEAILILPFNDKYHAWLKLLVHTNTLVIAVNLGSDCFTIFGWKENLEIEMQMIVLDVYESDCFLKA